MKIKPSSFPDKKIAVLSSKFKKAKKSVRPKKKSSFEKKIDVLKNKIKGGVADEEFKRGRPTRPIQKKFDGKKCAFSINISPSIVQYKHPKEITQAKKTQSLLGLDINNSSRISVQNFNKVKISKTDHMQSLARSEQLKLTQKTEKNIQQPQFSTFKKQLNSNPQQVKLPSSTRTKKNRKTEFPLGNLNTTKSKLDSHKVSGAVAGLFKLINEVSQKKAGLLDLEEPVFLQVECIKIPICRTKQLRFQLPHPLRNELSDILLITADKKGAKIYPDKAVEHYTELLAGHNIDFIQKVMPVRMLKQEYTQYEMRKKLVDQFDLILADANIIQLLPKLLGKFICYKRKMPIPVHLDRKNLKEHFRIAINKTQMTVKSNGHMSVVQVGHSKMGAGEITANIIEVAKWLAKTFPGGWQNIRSLNIKTSSSTSLPLYLSLKSPNMVRIPVEQRKKKAPVEGELSTMPGMTVVVKPDGTVVLKKVAEETLEDDSHDDEILEEAKKYIQSSKTIRYGESDDDDDDIDDTNDKKADAVTDAVEKAFLDNYKNTVESKTGDEDNEEEEEDEEESSDEDDKIIPTSTKKRRMDTTKSQPADKSPNKKQKKIHQQQHLKDNKNAFHSGPKKNKGEIQRRGGRGGKKNKLNKDQRKAMIKRKKAGKK